MEGRECDIGNSSNVLQKEQARKILDFVIRHLGKDVFISCDAGLSRSPGVLVALEQIFNQKDVSEVYRFHNKFVKNRIKDVWFKRCWRIKDGS